MHLSLLHFSCLFYNTVLSKDDGKLSSSRAIFSDLVTGRSSAGVHKMENLCRSVPGVMLRLYSIQKGTMSVEESVNHQPRA